MKFFLIIFFTISISFSDDIYFYDGCIIRNVHVLNKSPRILVFKKANTQIITINFPKIKNIEKKKIIKSPSVLENCRNYTKIYKAFYKSDLSFFSSHPNLYLLPLSFCLAALGYDYGKQGDELHKEIKILRELDLSTSALKKQRDRKYIMAGLFFASAIINTVFALKRFQFQSNVNQIGVNFTL